MKEAIEKILHEYACTYKQINFDSAAAREILAEFISNKLNGNDSEDSYNNESDTCCGGGCGCDS